MAIKMTIFNPKGGVGKTTSAKSLAGELSKRGYKVLLVDCDSSADTSRGISRSEEPSYELAKLIMEYCDEDFYPDEEATRSCICPTNFPNLDIMPAVPETMHMADNRLAYTESEFEPDKAFRILLKYLEDDYEYIIFDTKEGEGQWLKNVLNYVEYLICPAEAADDSINGYLTIETRIIKRYRRSNPGLKFFGMFITRFNNDSRDQSLVEAARRYKPEYFIPVMIRHSKILDSARMEESVVCYYKPLSNPAIDYASLTDYVLENTGHELKTAPENIRAFDAEKLINYTMLVYPDQIMDEYNQGKKEYSKIIKEYKSVAADYKRITKEDVSLPETDNDQSLHFCNHDEDYRRLLEDIEENGITEPLIVTPLNSDGNYMIIDGQKRLEAALELQVEVPIHIMWEMESDDKYAPILIEMAKAQIAKKVEYANTETRKLKKALVDIGKGN